MKRLRRAWEKFIAFVCKIGKAVLKGARVVQQANALAAFPKNIGIADESNLSMVATALVPAAVSPAQVTHIGAVAKTALVCIAKHAPVKAVVVAKLSAIPAATLGSAVLSCGACILIVAAAWFLKSLLQEYWVVPESAADLREAIDSLKECVAPAA
jgi:hypothetical protein